MKIDSRKLIYFGLLIGMVLLAYMAKAVFGPFILAALFAYLLNPLANFLTHHIRLPRTISITLIYVLLIGTLAVAVLNIGARISQESSDFTFETRHFVSEANTAIATMPDWIQPVAKDALDSIRSSLSFPHGKVVAFLPGAVNRTVSTLVFLVASFYFLRDGTIFIKNVLAFLPRKIEQEMDVVIGKIGKVMGDYLRGQLFLVIIMSTLTYIGLLIIGVRYALILSIFTGLAEIIPYVGPVVAAGVAMTVGFVDNYSRFGATPVIDATVIAALYTVLRQLEDLFIIPQIMGRMTKLHPLAVMFVVLAGGHLFGIIGFLVAVPLTASLKVVLEHFLPLVDTKNAL